MSEDTIENGLPLRQIIEAALLAAGEPLDHAQLASLFGEDAMPAPGAIDRALEELAEDCEQRGVELKKVASGWRLQVRPELHEYVQRLWTERPQRYSRALLETLALIAYRQPITRGEIEEVRGVSLASSIIRTLQEREWIRVVGHRDIPGKPALFGTTKAFLDYFNLETLDDLPTLAEIRDLDNLEPEFDFEPAGDEATKGNGGAVAVGPQDEDDVAHEDWVPEAADGDGFEDDAYGDGPEAADGMAGAAPDDLDDDDFDDDFDDVEDDLDDDDENYDDDFDDDEGLDEDFDEDFDEGLDEYFDEDLDENSAEETDGELEADDGLDGEATDDDGEPDAGKGADRERQ